MLSLIGLPISSIRAFPAQAPSRVLEIPVGPPYAEDNDTQRQSRCYIAGSNTPWCRALYATIGSGPRPSPGPRYPGMAGRGNAEQSHRARHPEATLQAGFRWRRLMTISKLSTARAALAFALISAVSAAVAQGAPPAKKPTVGGRPIVQAKPSTPMGCKLVGTVKGTKIWAGDCAGASELRGATPAEELTSPPAVAPNEKQ